MRLCKFIQIPNKFNEFGLSKLIATYYVYDISDLAKVSSLYRTLAKEVDYLYAYITINELEPKNLDESDYWLGLQNCYLSEDSLCNLDIDFHKFDTKYRNKMPEVRAFLRENKIHSTLQESPHGYHLVVPSEFKSICLKEISKILNGHISEDYTNVLALDGMVINGFETKTIENWT